MRIAQVLAAKSQWGDVGPELLDTGCGGRELAVVELARAWETAGHEVFCFVPRESVLRAGSVQWAPVDMAGGVLGAVPFDLIVAVECPEVLLDERMIAAQPTARKVAHYQVAHVAPEWLKAAEQYALAHGELPFEWGALSPWHADFLREQGVPGEISVFPNGIGDECFVSGAERDPAPLFHYSSSPDRGLAHMLEVWPLVRSELPDARLLVAYGLEDYFVWSSLSHRLQGEESQRVRDLMKLGGVEHAGRMGRKGMVEMLGRSSALLYPCDTASPTETGCITVLEALAAGCDVVTTDCDCLESEFAGVTRMLELPFDPDDFADLAVQAVDLPSGLDERLAFAEERRWSKVSELWLTRSAAARA